MFISPPDLITTPEIITSMVEGRIAAVEGMVTTAYNQANAALNSLASQTFAIDWTQPVISPVLSGLTGINADEPTTPTLSAIASANVSFNGAVPTTTAITIASNPVPEFVEKDYGFSIPLPPTVTWPSLNASAPGISDIQIPTAPGYTLPDVPNIDDIVIPAPPEFSVLEFEGVLPTDDITEPVVAFSWGEQAFSSEIYNRLNTYLSDSIVSGGSGLNEATEQAIYDRATSRMNEEEQALLNNVADGMAARGFPIPPGALVSANLEAENKVLRTRTDLNNDILVQQSNLAQKNTHFILEKSIDWQRLLVGYHSETQARALDTEKFSAGIAIQMYQAKILGYEAKVKAYAVLAEAYKARIQGELVKAEFYKAQMEGVAAHAEVKKALVQAYVAQVEAVKVLMEAYKVEMEGANIRAEIDKTRIFAFTAEVQAYSAQVQASTARYEGYKSQIEGEVAKAQMAKTDAEAYSARVSGFKAAADVEIARAEANLTNTKAETTVFTALIEKYKADVQKALTDADIAAKQEGLKIDVFKAGVSKYSAELDALAKEYLGAIETVKAQADVAIKSADIGVRATLGSYELAVQAAKGVATTAGSMVAGLGGAVNASIHAASSENRSDSRSWQGNQSSSSLATSNESVTIQHIYQHSS